MRVPLAMVLLLVLTAVPVAASRPLIVKGYPPAFEQEGELTPEEVAEARAVALRFGERWQATHDFGQIIDELFVRDFTGRLWQVPQDELPWLLLDKNLAVYASPQEMRRYYIAAMNFYGLYFGLHMASERLREKSESNESELKVTEVLSPEIISILLSNQTFVKLAELDKEARSDERTEEDDNGQPAERANSAQAARATTQTDVEDSAEQSEIGIIKKVPQLNEAAATLEKANELMRKRLAELSRRAQAVPAGDDTESEKEAANPSLSSLSEEEYGYPKDTPVMHLDSLPFCLDLIKIDGRYRILSAAIYID